MNNNPYTYYIICPNWKLYYGYRSANKVSPEEDLWNVYFSSSKPVEELRKQYDDALFVATVHKTFETDEDARVYEEKFLTENGCVKSDFWLNRAVYPKEFCTPEHMTEETKKKLSIALTGRKLSESHKENLRKPKPLRTEKHKENLSKSLRGRDFSESHKENMRKPKSDAHRKNMSISRMGSKNHMYGKKVSEDAIEKREATKRKKRREDPNYGKPKKMPLSAT
jgi:hypothetical protein